MSSMEASHKYHRPHITVGKDAEEEDVVGPYIVIILSYTPPQDPHNIIFNVISY